MHKLEAQNNQAEDSEQAVLGCLMIDPDQFINARKYLNADDFYTERNQNIWKAFEYFAQNGITADLVTIAERFDQTGVKYDPEYLDGLTNSGFMAYRLGSYCFQVKQASIRRQAKTVYREALDQLKDDLDSPSEDLIIDAMSKLLNIKSSEKNVFTMKDAVDILIERLKNTDGQRLLSTGFEVLDEDVPGVPRHSLISLAASSGSGKTVSMTNMAIYKARLGEKILIISLEIPILDLMEIMVPQLSDPELSARYSEMYSDDLSLEDVDRILNLAVKRLLELNIYFATDCYELDEIITVLDFHRKNFNIDTAFIDNAQLIDNAADYKEYTKITKKLKQYPLKNKVNIVLLSQLNDNREKRADKEPKATDMRGGKNLHQDSDIVLFLYKLDEDDDQVYLKLDKNRKGATSKNVYYELVFDADHRRVGLIRLDQKPEKEDAKPRRTPKTNYVPKDDDDY